MKGISGYLIATVMVLRKIFGVLDGSNGEGTGTCGVLAKHIWSHNCLNWNDIATLRRGNFSLTSNVVVPRGTTQVL